MKKFIATTLAVILFVMMVGVIGYTEHRYARKNCEIIAVENNKITVEDELGYLWTFDGGDFEKGEKVNLKMFDSCTGTMYDDEIVKVEKCN